MDIIARFQHLRQGLYYGWTMLVAVAIAQITSWGVLYYAFPIFLTPMQQESGWSLGELTGAYSLALFISGLAAIPVGRWLDKYGPRILMTVGSSLAVLLVLAWSQVNTLLEFYLVWIGIGLVMATVLYEPAFVMVAVWFHRLRSRALTVLTFVAGFASVIYIPLGGWLVEWADWRTTLLIFAGLLAVGTIPIHALVLRRRPQDLGLEPDGDETLTDTSAEPVEQSGATVSQAVRDLTFWYLNIAFFLSSVASMVVLVHLIPYLIQQGYSPAFAATVTGMIGLMALPGRLIFTPLGSWIARRYVTALIFGLQAVSFLVLIIASSTTAIILAVIIFGAGFGAVTPARAALIGELYGSRNYGSIAGILAFVVTLARSIAPVTAGIAFTMIGSYQPVFITLVALSGFAAIAALQTRPRLILQS